MKTALILFKELDGVFPAEYVKDVAELLKNGGTEIDVLEVLQSDDLHNFNKRLEEFKETADNLIIVGGENNAYSVKEVISSVMATELIENENALKFVEAISKSNGKEYSTEYAKLPIDATLIPNLKGPFQGYMLENEVFSLVVLPEEFDQLKTMCEGYVIPYFDNKYGIKRERFTFKYFGDEKLLQKVLLEAEENYDGTFRKAVKTKNGDTLVNIIFEGGSTDQAKRHVISNLGANIYAEFDTTLGERLFDLLKLRGVKISVAESFTGGRVVSSIISNSGASAYVNEGVVSYSNDSKKRRLNVKEEDLRLHGAVSSKVAYQMVTGLLNGGGCDVAISTTGIAGPKSDDTAKPVGLCFIAVGMKDGVHVYKYVLKGDREEITETAKNTALFLAIKKLKNI